MQCFFAKHIFKYKICLLLCSLAGLLNHSELALGGSLRASLEPAEGVLGEAFTCTVVVEGDLDGDIAFPSVPGLSVSGTGNSTQMQIINGHISRQLSLHFYLQVDKAGTYSIPPMSARIDGENLKTPVLTLLVKKPSDQLAAADSQLPNVFIERYFSQLKPYEGEAILKTTKLYYRVQLSDAERQWEPAADFRVYEAGKESSREQFGGQWYEVLNYYDILVPLHAGEIPVPAENVRVAILTRPKRGRSQDLFHDFFNSAFSQAVEKTLASQGETLNVKAVPQTARPADYLGIVGSFKLSSQLSTTNLKQGDTATLTIEVEGQGALDVIGHLPLQLGDGIKVYPDKPTASEKVSKDYGLQSKRVYKYALVPSRAGELPLGALTFSAFNPEKESFERLTTELGSLQVEAIPEEKKVVVAPSSQGGQSWSNTQSPIHALARDLLDIHRHFSPQSQHDLSFYDFLLAIFLSLGSLSLYLGSRLYRRWSYQQQGQGLSKLRSQALKRFRQQQRQWRSEWQHKLHDSAALEAYYHLFRQYLGMKLQTNGAAMTSQDWARHLTTSRLSAPLRENIVTLVKSWEELSYSSAPSQEAAKEKFLKTIDQLIEEIECQS